MKNKWPRGAIDGQLSVTWPRTVIAFWFVHFVSTIDGQLSLDWPRSAVAPKNMTPSLNSNNQNSMMLFTFFVFNRKYSFWANFIQKIKIVSLR